jgi:stage IV sporulation protein B
MHFRKFAKTSAFVLAMTMLLLFPASAQGVASAVWPVTGQAQMPKEVIPIGRTAGMKLFADGVIVIEISTLNTAEGSHSPAKKCGLQPGDIILQMEGEKIDSVDSLQKQIENVGERPVSILVRRGTKALSLTVTPVKDQTDSVYKIGAWVRDSMAGIGTITYYDPATGMFGALGHGIHDGETGILMPIGSGTLLPSSVAGVRKGEAGRPGELIGIFDFKSETGSLLLNDETGLYGRVDADKLYPELLHADPIPVGTRQEVVVGKAEIMSNVDGSGVKSYSIEIIKILDFIQDGKLIGAVTHVLVGDPVSGYGIFIENMLDTAQNLLSVNQAA